MYKKNPFTLLQGLNPKPETLPSDVTQGKMSSDDLDSLKKIGLRSSDLMSMVQEESQINYNRYEMYQDITRAADHWMVGSGVELYAEVATNYSQLHDASVWITSESEKYHRILTKFLHDIHIEEKIFDWAYTTALYGDLFVKMNAIPDLGVVSIDDNRHPVNMGRIDYNGKLIGFYENDWGAQSNTSTTKTALIPPWEHVHFRILGAKKTRALAGDPLHSEFRSLTLLGSSGKQYSSKYGTSVIINGLGPYKRLRMAEDSLLLARLTRGILRYIYKLKVDSGNAEAVAELMDQYTTMLKNARSIDTTSANASYDSKSNPFSTMEDIIIPVWGDVGDLSIEHIGGDPNIRWIVDLEELRNQLAAAIRVPLSLLGAYTKEASGALGSDSIEKLDIRFARSARRLQRAMIEGITRMCQIHLSWMNMDPDEELFQVHMAETSTAEEESLRESLDTGVDTIAKFMETLQDIAPNIDKAAVFDYLNSKILKLEDFTLKEFLLEDQVPLPESVKEYIKLQVDEERKLKKLQKVVIRANQTNPDISTYLPMRETCAGRGKKMNITLRQWESKWKTHEVQFAFTEHLNEVMKQEGKKVVEKEAEELVVAGSEDESNV